MSQGLKQLETDTAVRLRFCSQLFSVHSLGTCLSGTCLSVAHPRLGPLRALLQGDDPGNGGQGWRGRRYKAGKSRINSWAGEMEMHVLGHASSGLCHSL